jgi:hypothetical protein
MHIYEAFRYMYRVKIMSNISKKTLIMSNRISSQMKSFPLVSICLLAAHVGHINAGRILEKNRDSYSPGIINIGIDDEYRSITV